MCGDCEGGQLKWVSTVGVFSSACGLVETRVPAQPWELLKFRPNVSYTFRSRRLRNFLVRGRFYFAFVISINVPWASLKWARTVGSCFFFYCKGTVRLFRVNFSRLARGCQEFYRVFVEKWEMVPYHRWEENVRYDKCVFFKNFTRKNLFRVFYFDNELFTFVTFGVSFGSEIYIVTWVCVDRFVRLFNRRRKGGC